jgi:zinc protease
MAHLFEHLMFKATKTLTDGEFDRIMESHGAQTNAATWVDWTYYREKLPAGNLGLVTRLEADRMENMILNTEQLESEREVVINERLLRVDNDPEGTMYEALYALAFGSHPYGWPTIGWMEDIKAISLADCLEFYGRYYAPNNATVVVVGDVVTAEVLRHIEARYGHLPAQEIPAEAAPSEPPQAQERRAELELQLAADKGIYAWHAPAGGAGDHAAMEVLSEILAGGESSRLYRRLVTELELASEVGGWAPAWRYPGLYELGITMQPDKPIEQAEEVLDALIAEVIAAPPSERELTKAKNGLEADFLRSISATSSRARGMGDAETTLGDFGWFFDQADALRAVTAEDVLAVARRVFKPTSRTVVVARPCPETDA